MREIEFRGKLLSGKGWSFGNLRVLHGYEIITPDDTLIGRYGAVDPETVGQYTGLTDKNGKRIYEGDIIKFNDRICSVKWFAAGGGWDCHYLQDVIGGKETHRDMRKPSRWKETAEVIGNVYDNPELLENS